MNDAIRLARIRVTHKLSYFAPAIMAMRLVETDKIPCRMAIDQHGRCYWHPRKCSSIPIDELAGLLLHEVTHLLRSHFARAWEAGIRQPGKDLFRWNIATDFEINDDLHAFPLPKDLLFPDKYNLPKGKLAEWYYNQVPGGGDQPSPGDGMPSGNGMPSGGSAADGVTREYELPADSEQAPGLNPTEIQLIARQVARAMQSRGDLPAGWRRWADAILAPPVVPWWREFRAHFRRVVGQAAGRNDYTWSRLPRRDPFDPEVLCPAMYRPTVHIAVIIDTSGSMSDGQGATCLSELRGLIRTLNVPVDVIACDAAAAVSRRVLSPRRALLLGGGGTDMRVAIQTAQRLRPPPAVIVTMTDGETPWPSSPPRGAAHITLLLGEGKPPAWGRVIRVTS